MVYKKVARLLRPTPGRSSVVSATCHASCATTKEKSENDATLRDPLTYEPPQDAGDLAEQGVNACAPLHGTHHVGRAYWKVVVAEVVDFRDKSLKVFTRYLKFLVLVLPVRIVAIMCE